MKKRIFAVLASVLVLVTALAVPVFADDCSHNDVGHEMISATQHQLTCYSCGAWFEAESHSMEYLQRNSTHHEYGCSICGYGNLEPHTMVDGENDGGLIKECLYCHYYEEVEHLHTLAYKVLLEPTCGMENGLATDEWCPFCDYVGETYTISSAYTDHEYVDGVCIRCGLLGGEECDHSNVNIYTSQGSSGHTLSCNVCGVVVTSSPHDYSVTIMQEATHEKEGYKRYECRLCGYSYTDSYSMDVHECIYNGAIYHDDNQHVAYCRICLAPKYSNHLWDDIKITKQPSFKDKGIVSLTCTTCKRAKVVYLDALDADKIVDEMPYAEVVAFYQKMFVKYQLDLVEDKEMLKPYLQYYISVIYADIAKNGAKSIYAEAFMDSYYDIQALQSELTSDYTKGYNDALKTIIDENPIQGLFQGMWSGVVHFISVVGGQVSLFEVSLISVMSTLLIVAVGVLILKLFVSR